MDFERLQILLGRYFDQLLTVEERHELETMLLESPRAREAFWEMGRLNALIREWGQGEWGRREAVAAREPRTPSRPKAIARPRPKIIAHPAWNWRPLALAAGVVIGLLLGVAILPRVETQLVEKTSAGPPKAVAVLTQVSNVTWEDGSPEHHAGDVLNAGWLRLKTGAILVEFKRGARVVVEGPADLQIVSDNEAFLLSGKLRARVPKPALGFEIHAPGFSVVDLGTEFGCLVPLTGAAEVHVFTGGVTLTTGTAATTGAVAVRENEALRIWDGQTKTIAVNRTEFLSVEDLAKRGHLSERELFELWQKTHRELSANPATLVHFDFENDSASGQTLVNRAQRAPRDSNAKIIGCEWKNGRWQNKGALTFATPDDRLRMSLPGTIESLSLLAWVRVDSLPQLQHALLMTESLQPGEVHWYLYADGSLRLGERIGAGESEGWRSFSSTPFLKPEMFGAWIFLATVFDSATGVVTHYVNGEKAGEGRPGFRLPLRLDTFEIGNWGVRPDGPNSPGLRGKSPRSFARSFHGSIDEFAILSAPLDEAAIRKLYDQGRPGGE